MTAPRTIMNGVLALTHCALIMLLSYTVGALLGAAAGYVIIGKATGIIIGAAALRTFYKQPTPSRITRYYALKLSIMRGDLVLDWGYVSASVLVLVGWL